MLVIYYVPCYIVCRETRFKNVYLSSIVRLYILHRLLQFALLLVEYTLLTQILQEALRNVTGGLGNRQQWPDIKCCSTNNDE